MIESFNCFQVIEPTVGSAYVLPALDAEKDTAPEASRVSSNAHQPQE